MKVLAQVVTASTNLGWVNNFWSFGYAGKGCINENGKVNDVYSNSMQKELLRGVIYRN